jgi:hypothetical protein
MSTFVEYMYRAPGSTQNEELETMTIRCEPEDALKLLEPVGDTVTLRSGKYKVVGIQRHRWVGEGDPWADEGEDTQPGKNWFRVIVTEAD